MISVGILYHLSELGKGCHTKQDLSKYAALIDKSHALIAAVCRNVSIVTKYEQVTLGDLIYFKCRV